VVVVVVDGAVADVVGVAEVVGVAAVVAVVVGDAVADVVGDVGLTGSADARGTTIAAQAAPSAMKPRVERPNGTARVMESSFVLAASVFPGLWVCFARADTAVTQATKVAGQHGSGR
jgi:hypothetical protein